MAKKPLDLILEQISQGLKDIDQGILFGDAEEKHEALSQACVRYLKHRGFTVVEPEKPKYIVKKIDDLLHLFYAFSDSKHPELHNSYRNFDRDRKIASLFVKSRMEANGYGRKYAMAECAEIIETIFEHEPEFNFQMPISFGILGQKNCGWITDKAIQILNKKKMKTAKERRKKFIDELDKIYDAEPDGFGDLDEIEKDLEN